MKKIFSLVLACAMSCALMVPALATENPVSSNSNDTIYVDMEIIGEDEDCIYYYADLGSDCITITDYNGIISPKAVTTSDVAMYATYNRNLGIFIPKLVLAYNNYKIKNVTCPIVSIYGDMGNKTMSNLSSSPSIPDYTIQLAAGFSGLLTNVEGTETAIFSTGTFTCTNGVSGKYNNISATFAINR